MGVGLLPVEYVVGSALEVAPFAADEDEAAP
jgi:hypothetical protein